MPELCPRFDDRALRCWLALSLLASLIAPAAASELRNSAIVKAVHDNESAVVNIHGHKTVRAENASFGTPPAVRQVNGMGTGVVIDARGYILTNYHVVEGVSNIQVSLADGKATVARLVSNDPKTDLAVIKIDTKEPLTVIRFGTSCDLMKGEQVIAIGNAYGYEHTVTRGIISALHRNVQVSDEQKYNDLIQCDASINPGNSGGPLLNIDGLVIGINVATRVGAQGIGFAIPIDETLEIAARLVSTERLEQTSHGIIGKTRCEPGQKQFVVSTVRSESPAGKAGLKSGDIITAVGTHTIESGLDVELALLGSKPGQDVEIEVLRDSQTVTTKLAVTPLSKTTKNSALADKSWTTIGLKMAVMDQDEFKGLSTRYRGGLTVLDVRPGSPAAQQGIRRGDILVGMHIWETISLENIAYILERDDLSKLDSIVFYIIRGADTLYGHMRLATRTTP
ncbi:MAG TPA: trypsin-like peptidase domain-containing protein [Pirellulaceae bacterium]|nr:trypsin-like peptidase domain-containing protein [Pirellulaceae bacterium]